MIWYKIVCFVPSHAKWKREGRSVVGHVLLRMFISWSITSVEEEPDVGEELSWVT